MQAHTCVCVCVDLVHVFLPYGISVNKEKQPALIKITDSWACTGTCNNTSKPNTHTHSHTYKQTRANLKCVNTIFLGFIWGKCTWNACRRHTQKTHTCTHCIFSIKIQLYGYCEFWVDKLPFHIQTDGSEGSLLAAYVTRLLFIEMKRSLHPFVLSKSINSTYLILWYGYTVNAHMADCISPNKSKCRALECVLVPFLCKEWVHTAQVTVHCDGHSGLSPMLNRNCPVWETNEQQNKTNNHPRGHQCKQFIIVRRPLAAEE